MAAQPAGVSTTPPSFVSSANLLRVHSNSSSRSKGSAVTSYNEKHTWGTPCPVISSQIAIKNEAMGMKDRDPPLRFLSNNKKKLRKKVSNPLLLGSKPVKGWENQQISNGKMNL